MATDKPKNKQQETRDKKGRFVPGVSGNPNGRPPKGHSITDMFKQMLDNTPEKKLELVEAIYNAAIAGDSAAQKMIWNYMDGMPQQKTDVSITIPRPILGGSSVVSIDDGNQKALPAPEED